MNGATSGRMATVRNHTYRVIIAGLTIMSSSGIASAQAQEFEVASFDRVRVLKAAGQYLSKRQLRLPHQAVRAVPGAATTSFPKVTTGGQILRIPKDPSYSAMA